MFQTILHHDLQLCSFKGHLKYFNAKHIGRLCDAQYMAVKKKKKFLSLGNIFTKLNLTKIIEEIKFN